MRLLLKIDNLLAAGEKGLVVLLFAALSLLMAFNIVSRNLFQVSFQRALELTPALVLWLALTGSSLALRDRRHIRLELFLRYCPPPVRRLADRAGCLFGMAVTGILFAASLDFVANEVSLFGAVGWTTVIFPLFFGLAVFRYLILMLTAQGDAPPATGGDSETPPRRAPLSENR